MLLDKNCYYSLISNPYQLPICTMYFEHCTSKLLTQVVLVSSVEQEEGWGVRALCWAASGYIARNNIGVLINMH